jgi:hypothetical protein
MIRGMRGNYLNDIGVNLFVYCSLSEYSILWELADFCETLTDGTEMKATLRGRVFRQVKNLLTVATDLAFEENLWLDYLMFLLINDDTLFGLDCDRMGAQD